MFGGPGGGLFFSLYSFFSGRLTIAGFDPSMFGPAPPSQAEIKAMEETASQTVQATIVTCVLLYLCMYHLILL